MAENKDIQGKLPSVLHRQGDIKKLHLYQKSDVIYQLAYAFCERFIHLYKDRTRDQVIQAARSCKQNIVEGIEDGVTSSEMQLKLVNVARASLQELREDFEDYLKSRHLVIWQSTEPRYDKMLKYCRYHNKLEDYEPYFNTWTDEEMCNCALTLCHMEDKMLMSTLERFDREFVTEGGIKERMYKARTGYRNLQVETLQQQLAAAQESAKRWQQAYEDLKQRALAAYRRQQEEIEELRRMVERGDLG